MPTQYIVKLYGHQLYLCVNDRYEYEFLPKGVGQTLKYPSNEEAESLLSRMFPQFPTSVFSVIPEDTYLYELSIRIGTHRYILQENLSYVNITNSINSKKFNTHKEALEYATNAGIKSSELHVFTTTKDF